MRNFVLVGGLGFIGSNILEQLLIGHDASPYFEKVIVIDNYSNNATVKEAWGQKCIILKNSYNDGMVSEALSSLKGPTTFLFLAGETRVAESVKRPVDFLQANIMDPATFVVKNVRANDDFILASTAGALFDGKETIGAESVINPKNVYGASKAAQELLLRRMVEAQDGQFGVVRFSNVYGRYSSKKKSAIHAFVRAALASEEIVVNGDGNQTRDFIYAGDLAKLVLSYANPENIQVRPSVATIASGNSESLKAILEYLENYLTTDLNVKFTENSELLKSEPRNVCIDSAALYLPDVERMQLGAGLEHTVRFYTELNM